ncbi:MAG: MFS transporter, partial [Pseudomonadota bacterium]|nr:MFS transporter [Pseudomonadota bacterium]
MDQVTTAQRLATTPVRAIHLRVLLLCTLINLLDGFDILAISYTAPAISEAWNIGKMELGSVFAAGMIGMAVGSLVLGPLSDLIGRKGAILTCLLIIATSMLATPGAASVTQLVVLRAITGVGIGGILPALNTMVAEFAPERRRNLMVSTMHLGYPIGATAGGFLAAWTIPEFGWGSVFTIGGVATLCMFPLVLFGLPESPEFLCSRGTQRSRAQLQRIMIAATGQAPEPDSLTPAHAIANQGKSRFLSGFLALFRSGNTKPTLLLWSAYFCGYLTFYFLLSWIPTILVDSGLPLEQAIYVGIALNLGGGAGMLLLGALTGRDNLRTFVAAAFVLACIGMFIFSITDLPLRHMLLLTGVIGFFGLAGLIGLYSIAARLYPAPVRATGVGISVGMGRLGGIAGPLVGGQLMALGWGMRDYFTLLGAPLILAAIAILAMGTRSLSDTDADTT